MEFAQTFVFDAGWIFFSAWGLVLVALSLIAFKQDLFPINDRPQAERRQFSAQ